MVAQVVSDGALRSILFDCADGAGELNARIERHDDDYPDQNWPSDLRPRIPNVPKRPREDRQSERKQNQPIARKDDWLLVREVSDEK